MNIVDILELVGKSEDIGDVAVSLRLYRACGGKKAMIVPGLLADVLYWGDRENPSVVSVKNVVVRDWAARSKHAMFRTWALAREKEQRDQALTLIRNTFSTAVA